MFSRYFLSWEPLQIEKEETGNAEQKKILGIKCWPSSDYIMTCSNLGKGKGVVAKTPGTSGF